MVGRVAHNGELCKKWQALLEHFLGRLLMAMGFDPIISIITKKNLESASADYGLIALAYNPSTGSGQASKGC